MSATCGTVGGYRQHHRADTDTCQPCRDAQAAWRRRYEIRRYIQGKQLIDSTGTNRRLRALCAMGWPLHVISARLGTSGRNMHRLLAQDRVHRDTAAKVAAIYGELSMTTGPSPRSRQLARRNGWPPPLSWDDESIDDPKAKPYRGWTLQPSGLDEVAVQRAMRGEQIRLSRVERAEAVRRLTARGMSATEIAECLRIDPRSVARLRSEQREAAA